MDTQTRHALKQDKFVNATTSGLEWVGEHRTNVIAWLIGVVAAVAIVVISFVLYQKRETAANQVLGQAMDIYETPLTQPNQPAEPGLKTYATAAERAKAAYPLYRQTADQYGWLTAGQMARYFAGLTELDMGQKPAAEADAHPTTTVPKAAAQLQLAQLYETTQPQEARRLYAEIKDQDKQTDAAQIATQKLQTLK